MLKILFLMIAVFIYNFFSFAIAGTKAGLIEHKDATRCEIEIKNLNCGSPSDYKAFLSCLDYRYDELSEECQDFQKVEFERFKNSY